MTVRQSAETLLHTKLMPPRIHSAVIPRPVLVARLNEGLTKKLILVNAPTGFGKTTLVRLWLSEAKIRSAWVALDGNDNDLVRFWTYVISALRTLDPAVGRAALATLATAQLPSFQTVLIPFINELAGIAAPCVLVLEDYHAVTVKEIHATVAFLLQHLPEGLHLALVSRTEPDLPLGILRARDELVELHASELRFTLSETSAFLRETVGAEIPASAMETLYERTEGWVAGLRLAARSLQEKRDPAGAVNVIQSFSGSQPYVADYLIREVFENQPASVQMFLLKTCFLDRLTGSLCDAVMETSGGNFALEQIEKDRLFLAQLEHGGGQIWYRYHPLFAETLRPLARQRLGEAVVQLIHEKAVEWYAYQQLYAEAIETALAARLFERAIALLEAFVEIYGLNETRTLARWTESIPQALTMQHPLLCLMYAQVILFTSDRFAPATAARIEPYLRAAEQTWQAQSNDEKVGSVLALRGMMLLWQGEFQKSLEAVYEALAKMPESEIFWRGVSLLNAAGGELNAGRLVSAQDKILEARALLGASQNTHGMLAATGMMSEILYAQGELNLCAQLNQQIIAEAVGDDSMLDDQGAARLSLANVAYEKNDLETAARFAAEALELSQRRANDSLQAQATSRLAFIQVARGEIAPARERLKALLAQLRTPLAVRELRAAEALIAIREGDMGPQTAWLTRDETALPMLKERELFILARLRIVQGRSTEAPELLQPCLLDAADQGRVRSQAEALCLKALAYHAAGDLPKAGQTLMPALTLGHEKGFRRLFLDEGAPMAALLRELLPGLAKHPLHLYVTTLLHLFSREMVSARNSAPGNQALVDPLSPQEIRVLRLLAAGRTNSEIASELIVSTNTVKTHVKNIYSKLSINSREEARIAARELKLA